MIHVLIPTWAVLWYTFQYNQITV